ncbi:MAG: SDR family NAD(P)-dependent oxidoreductase [Deltaproteobacteria bacterium]|nr:SDR family NAD(P)-dependent oxidoreductase [Deltaproteobacteria bacterium]
MKPEGVAMVTGASRGIGRAVALELAARGFEVVATMRDPATGADLPALAAERGGRLSVERLDVDRPETIAMPRGLRVLVNNAGIEGEYLAVEDATIDHWRRIFETNVFGVVETTRRAIPEIRASGGGVICNVTSSSLLFPMPFYAAYRASKAAVSAFGESLRTEVAPLGIRVVEILPGPIDTDMLAKSSRPAESGANESYRELADLVFEQRKQIGPFVTPPAQAAAAIAEAVLDDAAPLRHGCDPMSVGSLEGWRGASDEDFMWGFLGLFGIARPEPTTRR